MDTRFWGPSGWRLIHLIAAAKRKESHEFFELLPFDNDLVIVKFKGNQLQDILNQIATKKGEPVSGIRMRINQNLAEEISTYYVVSSDYLLNNGDNFQIPTPIERIDLNIKLRDAVFKYFIELKKNQITLSPKLDGRIY